MSPADRGLQIPERGSAPVVDDHLDTELLARVAEFYRALEKDNVATEAWHARHDEAEAMTDCPPSVVPADDQAGHDRWDAFMKAKGVWKLSDKANAAARAMGKAANRVFAIPARTCRGAAEKVKIAYLATGDGEGTGTGNGDLEAYQDIESPWMKNAIADLERLAVPPPTEPMVEDPAVVAGEEAAEAKEAWLALPHSTIEDEETPEHQAAETRWHKAEEDFAAAPVTSIPGVFIKLRAMLYLIREDTADGEKPTWTTGHVDTLSTFLEGAPVPAPVPDPAVVLFAEWGALEDEIIAFGKAHPDFDDPDVEKRRDKLGHRQSAVEDQIIETAATSVGGIAVKLRLLAYMKFPYKGLPELYATPAKDTDFEGFILGWREEKGLFVDETLLIDSLRDAERLAGVL